MPNDRSSVPEIRVILIGGFVLTLGLVILGVGTVRQRYQIYATKAATRDLESKRAAAERQHDELQGQVAALLNPEFLQRQNQAFALGLVPTSEQTVIRVSEPVTRRLAAKRHRDLLLAEGSVGRPPAEIAAAEAPDAAAIRLR